MSEPGENPALKARLRTDLTAAMKSRDKIATATLRMALTAVTNAEVAGDHARELSDADVIGVLVKEVRKRKEAAEAFEGGGRAESAERERAESRVLESYLPAALSDAELAELTDRAVAEVRSSTGGDVSMRQMGQVIKAVQQHAAGRAEGARIAAAVKARLS